MRKVLILIFFVALVLFCSAFYFLIFKKHQKPPLEKELYLYNWEDYLSEKVIEDFEKKFGVKVHLDTFDDSDFAFSQIQTQPDKYDLFVIEQDYVYLMRNLKLLSPLDHSQIPNLKNLKPQVKNPPYDPQNQYCVPYVAGYTGILINTKYVKDFDGTRKILFDEKYKGKIIMTNNSTEVLINALFALGKDPETASFEDWQEAKELAKKQKELVLGYFDPIKQTELMVNEEAWISYHYSSDVLVPIEKNPHLKFFAPKEGVLLWTDSWCIPKDAKHKRAAHAFLNFLLEPEVSAKNSQNIKIPMPVEGIEKFLSKDFLSKTEGLNFPKEKEILEKSRYFTFQIQSEEIQKIAAELSAELGIGKKEEE